MSSTIKNQCSYLTVLFVLVALNSQAMSRSLQGTPIAEKHKQWMAQHGRAYKDPKEEQHRLKIFKDNVEYIESFNKDVTKPYKLKVNQFADLTDEEFKSHNGLKIRQVSNATSSLESSLEYENYASIPSTKDWRSEGAVTPVKNQGLSCQSCWAFSVVASMEGLLKIRTGRLTSLSEQEMIDCDIGRGDHGCNKGNFVDAFTFIVQNQGLTTEANYPYRGFQGYCYENAAAVPATTITSFVELPAYNEDALLRAVANQPVSVGIASSSSDFRNYAHGVLTECDTQVDHGVTIVGYGTDRKTGIDYWLVKNSWGTGWGEDGYIRMRRGVNLCGIATRPSYPVVV